MLKDFAPPVLISLQTARSPLPRPRSFLLSSLSGGTAIVLAIFSSDHAEFSFIFQLGNQAALSLQSPARTNGSFLVVNLESRHRTKLTTLENQILLVLQYHTLDEPALRRIEKVDDGDGAE